MCQECNIEVIGRITYRNHTKKYHGAGFHCELCGKSLATKTQLDIHKKTNHEDTTWLQA